jgi:uncharacterized membrane protein YfcA
MELVILVIVGLVASSLGSLIGLGGGIIVVPALLSWGRYLGLEISLPKWRLEHLYLR